MNGDLTEGEEWPTQEFGDERSRREGGRCNGSEAAMCWHMGRIAPKPTWTQQRGAGEVRGAGRGQIT